MARKKREDGRVQVQLDLGVDRDGKRLRKSFYGKSLTEARMRRDAWIKQRDAAPEPTSVTLEEWSKQWLESTKDTTEPSTYRQRRSAIRQQNIAVINGQAFGGMDMREIKPIHIQTYLNGLADMSKGTIKHRRFVLHSIMDTALANDIIKKSPWQSIRAPKGTYEGHRALGRDEQNLVLDMLGHHRCGIWALTMMFTGMRREELAALDARDIDWDARQIYVHRALRMADGGTEKEPKTEAGERVVPIFDTLYEPLKAFVGDKKNGLLFRAAKGGVLTETAFAQAWVSYMLAIERHINGIEPCEDTKGYRRAATIKRFETDGIEYREPTPFTPHDLRYTYATILYDAEVDVKTAAYLLGHADITVTMAIYTKLSAKKKQKGLDALHEYINKEFKPEDHKPTGDDDHHLTTI